MSCGVAGPTCTSYHSLAYRHFAWQRKRLETLCRKTLENGMFMSRVIALRMYTCLSRRMSKMASCITSTV